MSVWKKSVTLSLLTLLFSLTISCELIDIKNPEVIVTQSHFKALSLKKGRLDNQLRITNPNIFKLSIKALTYRLVINDKEFLTGTSSHKIKIPAGGSQLVELPLEIEYKKLLTGLESIFKKKGMRFQLNGEIDFGLIKVPFRKSGAFSI